MHRAGTLTTGSQAIAFAKPTDVVSRLREIVLQAGAQRSKMQSQLIEMEHPGGMVMHVDVHGSDVSDDGHFDSAGSVYMLRVLMWITPRPAKGSTQGKPAVALDEVRVARNLLLPWVETWYQIRPTETGQLHSDWMFCTFFAPNGRMVVAATDFDWVKHRFRSRSIRVTRENPGNPSPDVIYCNDPIPEFYQSHTENRGTFLHLDVMPPPESNAAEKAFAGLAQGLKRKGILHASIVPISLEWAPPNRAVLRYRETGGPVVKTATVQVPSSEDLLRGSFRIPFDDAPISTVDQYVSAAINYLKSTLNAGKPIR